jgi:hypothetical protein
MDKKEQIKKWFSRLGIAGFLFFLVKGLLWILLFALVYFGLVSDEKINAIKSWFSF